MLLGRGYRPASLWEGYSYNHLYSNRWLISANEDAYVTGASSDTTRELTRLLSYATDFIFQPILLVQSLQSFTISASIRHYGS